MPRIGITGHSNLTDATEKVVHQALQSLLLQYSSSDLVGITCLARGADQPLRPGCVGLGRHT